jgi:hypothetical protein
MDWNWALALIAGYAFIGFGIKYIDQVFDEHVFSRKLAMLLAVLTGLVMGYFIAVDHYSAVIFVAIVLSVAIFRKVDNIAFYIGVLLVLVVPIALAVYRNHFEFNWLALGILTLSGFADELGNDLADAEKMRGLGRKFFLYRFTMKLGMLVLTAYGFFPPIYFVAFLAFDTAYGAVDWYSMKVIKRTRGLLLHR